MKKLKVLVVDDEASPREQLVELLHSLSNIEILGSVDSVAKAYEMILEFSPDLVLLDIEMPGETGFDLLQKLDSIDFDIVFTTGYDSYAIQAIKFSALDYLLKPITKGELSEAIQKSLERGYSARMSYYENLLQNLKQPTDDPSIVLKEKERSTVVRLSEIIRLESDRNYTRVILQSGNKILLSKTMKVFDAMLKGQGFMRIHKSHLVNQVHVKGVEHTSNLLLLSNGDQVPISVRKRKELFDYLRAIRREV